MINPQNNKEINKKVADISKEVSDNRAVFLEFRQMLFVITKSAMSGIRFIKTEPNDQELMEIVDNYAAEVYEMMHKRALDHIESKMKVSIDRNNVSAEASDAMVAKMIAAHRETLIERYTEDMYAGLNSAREKRRR